MPAMTLIERLRDLARQATMEKSHYYVAACLLEAIMEIERLDHLHKLDHSLADQWQKKNEGLVEVIKTLEVMSTHDWCCGCGHWNGASLATCADCGRKPGEV